MLRLRNVLTIVWCRFGSWSLVIKLIFGPDFEHKVWSRLWSWSSGEILKLKLSQYFAADPWLWLYEDYSWSRLRSYWSRFWSLSLVKMLIFGWGFEVAAWTEDEWNLIKICLRACDMIKRSYFGNQSSTLGSVVPLALFYIYILLVLSSLIWKLLCLGARADP